MIRDVPGRELDQGALGRLEPLRVLYEFDGPRIFVTEDPSGNSLLAYLWDEDDDFLQYLVVPTSDGEVERLTRGHSSVRDALEKPWAWTARVRHLNALIDSLRAVDMAVFPVECLPKQGVMLLPSLQPLLNVRLTGDEIKPGTVPGSAIRQAINGTEQALKTLLDRIWRSDPRGRPPGGARQLYDLPTQRFAFGSFEISFGKPQPTEQLDLGLDGSCRGEPEGMEALEKAGADLRTALKWATTGGDEDLSDSEFDENDKRALLVAAKHLTPTRSGPVARIEVGGVLLRQPTGMAFTLTSNSRQKIEAGLKRLRSKPPAIVSAIGLIRALDRDKKTFRFREDETGAEHHFVFDADRFDEVLEAFADDQRVQLAGQALTLGGPVELALIRTLPEPD